MEIKVTRHATKDGATIGTLSVGGVPSCFSLEDAVREVVGLSVESWKIPGETAIPRGTYTVLVTFSPHFKMDLPLLVGVPGYAGVRIHPGNTAADTEGCLLVGYDEGSNTIGRSRLAFAALFDQIKRAWLFHDPITITIA